MTMAQIEALLIEKSNEYERLDMSQEAHVFRKYAKQLTKAKNKTEQRKNNFRLIFNILAATIIGALIVWGTVQAYNTLVLKNIVGNILFFGTGFIVLMGLISLWATRPRLQIVPEEKRLVIYRFGKFARIAGPGQVWVRRRIDQVERTLDVREQPHYLRFTGLYAYDIPIGYTLSLWYKLDPQAAANGDQHMLRKLAQFDSKECDENIRIRIHDLFIKHIAETMSRHQLPAQPTTLDKLIPFCPGQQQCNETLSKIRSELPEVLRSFGAIMNPDQPIAIKDFHLSNSIIQLLDRDRVIDDFLPKIPVGEPDLLTQAALALEGMSPQNMRKIIFEYETPLQLSHIDTLRTKDPPTGQQAQAGHRNIPIVRSSQEVVLA